MLYRGFQKEKTDERAFIVFECLETPMKHKARVFEMASILNRRLIANKSKKQTKEQKKAKFI